MTEGTSIEDNLTVFKEIIADMEILKVKYDDKDLELILLYSLPSSYMSFRKTILYSRNTLIVDEVCDAMFLKEKMKLLVFGSDAHGEDFVVCERNSGG